MVGIGLPHTLVLPWSHMYRGPTSSCRNDTDNSPVYQPTGDDVRRTAGRSSATAAPLHQPMQLGLLDAEARRLLRLVAEAGPDGLSPEALYAPTSGSLAYSLRTLQQEPHGSTRNGAIPCRAGTVEPESAQPLPPPPITPRTTCSNSLGHPPVEPLSSRLSGSQPSKESPARGSLFLSLRAAQPHSKKAPWKPLRSAKATTPPPARYMGSTPPLSEPQKAKFLSTKPLFPIRIQASQATRTTRKNRPKKAPQSSSWYMGSTQPKRRAQKRTEGLLEGFRRLGHPRHETGRRSWRREIAEHKRVGHPLASSRTLPPIGLADLSSTKFDDPLPTRSARTGIKLFPSGATLVVRQ